MVIFLDIETAPAADLPDPGDGWINKGCGNIKDPAKIEAKQEENRSKWREGAALDWRLGQICAIGLSYEGTGEPTIILQDDRTEAEVLTECWAVLAAQPREMAVAGFNVRSFDLPFLVSRSAVCGVAPSRSFKLARYRSDLGVVDWLDLLSWWGEFSMAGWSLADYARAFHLEAQPFGDGKEIPDRWAAGDYDYIRKHLTADLAMVRELHERFGWCFVG